MGWGVDVVIAGGGGGGGEGKKVPLVGVCWDAWNASCADHYVWHVRGRVRRCAFCEPAEVIVNGWCVVVRFHIACSRSVSDRGRISSRVGRVWGGQRSAVSFRHQGYCLRLFCLVFTDLL